MENRNPPRRSDDEDSDAKSSVKKLCCSVQFFWFPRFGKIPEFNKKVSKKKLKRKKKKKKCEEGIDVLNQRILELEDDLDQAKCSCTNGKKVARIDSEIHQEPDPQHSFDSPKYSPPPSSQPNYARRRSTRFGFPEEEYHQQQIASRSSELLEPELPNTYSPENRQSRETDSPQRPSFYTPFVSSQPSVTSTTPTKEPQPFRRRVTLGTPNVTSQPSATPRTSSNQPEPQALISNQSTESNRPSFGAPYETSRPSAATSTTSTETPESQPLISKQPMESKETAEATPPPQRTPSPSTLVNEAPRDEVNLEPLIQRHRLYSPVSFEKTVAYEKPVPSPKKSKTGPKPVQDIKPRKSAIRKPRREEEQKMAFVQYYDPSSESDFWVDAMCLTEAWKSQSPKKHDHRSRSPPKDRYEQWSRAFDNMNRPGGSRGSPERRSSPREKTVSFDEDDRRHHPRGSYHVHRRYVKEEQQVEPEPMRRTSKRGESSARRGGPSVTMLRPSITQHRHGYLPSSRENMSRPIDVRDFVRFIATLSNNSVTSVGNKRKSIALFKDYLNGNVQSRKKR